MDEVDVVLRARRFSARLTAEQVGLPLESYLHAMSALPEDTILRLDTTLASDEAGHTLMVGKKRVIIVNGNDPAERQRFTACHEVAHVVLELPTEHQNGGSQFARRSPNETLCDIFAAELMLPSHLFQPLVRDSDIELVAIEGLAGDFIASLTATGSRFAAVCDRPCAFVLIRDETIRYASISTSLRECRAWIRPGRRISDASLAAALLRGEKQDGPIEVKANEWFEDWRRGGDLLEEAQHFPRWNQTVALLWFDDDRVPSASADYDDQDDDEDPGLRPLDGILPWPGRNRRRP